MFDIEETVIPIVGDPCPDFDLTAVTGTDPSKDFHPHTTLATYGDQWKVLFFWPKDFTFVCPTEIVGFGDLYPEFKKEGAELIGASTDSDFVHAAWREHHSLLKKSPFPWLADIKKDLAISLGILNEAVGVANRATFIIDPDNIIRYMEMTDLSVGRNPAETLRILRALKQSREGKLLPCNWQPGEKTL